MDLHTPFHAEHFNCEFYPEVGFQTVSVCLKKWLIAAGCIKKEAQIPYGRV